MFKFFKSLKANRQMKSSIDICNMLRTFIDDETLSTNAHNWCIDMFFEEAEKMGRAAKTSNKTEHALIAKSYLYVAESLIYRSKH